jgi:transposase-like protein
MSNQCGYIAFFRQSVIFQVKQGADIRELASRIGISPAVLQRWLNEKEFLSSTQGHIQNT